MLVVLTKKMIISDRRVQSREALEELKNTDRIKWIDIVKGIAIILMLIGHMLESDSIIRMLIYSFHMPLFILINGYFIKNFKIFDNIKKSMKSLLLPYLIVQGAVAVLGLSIKGWNAEALYHLVIKDTFGGMSKVGVRFGRFTDFHSVGAIWFLPSLFLMRNIYILLMTVIETKKINGKLSIAIILVLSFIGYYIGNYYAYCPWSLDVALYSLVFIAIGNIMRRKRFFDELNIFVVTVSFVVWVSFLALDMQIELAKRWYPAVWGGAVCAVAGSICVIWFGRWMENNSRRLSNALAWAGGQA